MTCVACKLMETIVRNTMNDYLDDNNLLSVTRSEFAPSVTQYGFRNKHSIVSSLLLSQYNYVNRIKGKEDIDVIFFDFCEAFDAVNHNLLLMKIVAYGFSKFALNWISDFLRDRQQFVNIGSARSKVVSVTWRFHSYSQSWLTLRRRQTHSSAGFSIAETL